MATFSADIIRKPEWKAIIAAEMAREQKRELAKADKVKVPQDDSADWLKWKREMEKLPGMFVACELMPNWLNKKVPSWVARAVVKMQRRGAFEKATEWREKNPKVLPPYLVTITRYGPHPMDDDGNTAAVKRQRDGVARALDIDDGKTELIRFVPAYTHAKFYGYRVLIEGT
jgi:hypothetical protein